MNGAAAAITRTVDRCVRPHASTATSAATPIPNNAQRNRSGHRQGDEDHAKVRPHEHGDGRHDPATKAIGCPRLRRDLHETIIHVTGSRCHRHMPPTPGKVRDDLPVGAERMSERRVVELRSAALTYPEVGRTKQSDLPADYRTFRRSALLPVEADFGSAKHELLSWMIQRRAGLRVCASGDVTPGAVVDLRLGLGWLSLVASCRVIYVIDETNRCGFAYGTLPGHPESGEESFVLDNRVDGTITITITAFSRPVTVLSKLAAHVGVRVQDVMTARYLRAFG
jgi:uncharacterized protein (UPF0548 family)